MRIDDVVVVLTKVIIYGRTSTTVHPAYGRGLGGDRTLVRRAKLGVDLR